MLGLLLATGCGGSSGDSGASRTRRRRARPRRQSGRSPGLSLVAIGDSIPYNSADDCPGCTGFVDRYADAVAEATGKTVETTNLSSTPG